MEYKEYNHNFLDQVVDLLNICFPNYNITKQSFLWKHFHPFFEGKTQAMIAVNNEIICAFVCFTPMTLKIDNKLIDNFYSCSVQATHPNYRRKGIISKLTKAIECKLGNVEYLGFSNNQGINIDKYSSTINYQILGSMRTHYVLSLPYSSAYKFKQINNLTASEYQYSQIGVYKSKDYLNWRYADNPKNRYKYYEILYNNKLFGLIIFKNSKYKINVNEIIINNDNENIIKQIIKSFASFAFHQKKYLVSYSYLLNNVWQRAFPLLSFSKSLAYYLTIKTKQSELLFPDRWLIQAGDIQ